MKGENGVLRKGRGMRALDGICRERGEWLLKKGKVQVEGGRVAKREQQKQSMYENMIIKSMNLHAN